MLMLSPLNLLYVWTSARAKTTSEGPYCTRTEEDTEFQINRCSKKATSQRATMWYQHQTVPGVIILSVKNNLFITYFLFLEHSSIYQIHSAVSLNGEKTNQLLNHWSFRQISFSFLTLNICLTFCRGRLTFSLCISWSTSLILRQPSPFLSASSNVCFNHIEQELRNIMEYQGMLLNRIYIKCLGKTVHMGRGIKESSR